MNGMCSFYADFFPCAAFHFARASRSCFAVSSDRCLSQMYPNRGPREMFLHPSTRQRMSRLRPPGRMARASLGALDQDALLLANRYAARVLPAKPSIAGAGARILAARVRTQSHAVGAHGGTACGGAGKHVFRTRRDRCCELLDEIVQQAVHGLRHSVVREMGLNYGRWGSLSSSFGNELLQPTSYWTLG